MCANVRFRMECALVDVAGYVAEGPIAVMRTGVTVESEPKKPVHTFNNRGAEYPSSECKPAAAELAQVCVRHEVARGAGRFVGHYGSRAFGNPPGIPPSQWSLLLW